MQMDLSILKMGRLDNLQTPEKDNGKYDQKSYQYIMKVLLLQQVVFPVAK